MTNKIRKAHIISVIDLKHLREWGLKPKKGQQRTTGDQQEF